MVLMDNPSNPRSPGTYFMLPSGFLSASLVATQDYHLRAGQVLDLTYGILALDGVFDAARVQKLYDEWLELP